MSGRKSRTGGRGVSRGGAAAAPPTPGQQTVSPVVSQVTRPGDREPLPGREMVWGSDLVEVKEKRPVVPYAKRPEGVSHVGKELDVRVNYYQLDLNFSGLVFVYKVDFQTARGSKALYPEQKRAVVWSWIKVYDVEYPETAGRYAYDGASCLFSLNKIDLQDKEVAMDKGVRLNIQLPGELGKINFTMKFNFVGQAEVMNGEMTQSVGDFTILSMVDTILHQKPCHPFLQERFVTVGNNFYKKPNENLQPSIVLSGGRYSLFGATANTRRGLNGKLYVNVDTSNCLFYQPLSCIDFMVHAFNEAESTNVYRVSQLNEETQLPTNLREILRKYIKGLKVDLSYFKKAESHKATTRIVMKVGECARVAQFTPTFGDNSEPSVTVEQYMLSKHGLKLKYPLLPVLIFGTGKRQCYIPVELCSITPYQRCTRTLPEADTTTMIRQLCTVAPKRSAAIDGILEESKLGQDPWAQSFNLELKNEKAKVPARVLAAPRLEHGISNKQTPQNGAWASRPPMPPMLHPAKCTGTVVIRLCGPRGMNNENILHNLNLLYSTAKSLGFIMPDVPPPIIDLELHKVGIDNSKHFDATVMPLVREARANLIIIVMSGRNSRDYGTLKRICETEFSIATQCVLVKNIRPLKPMTAYNLLLKINVKLSGTNWMLVQDPSLRPIYKTKTMIVGIDVSHPGGRDQRVPSLAALVGSVDIKMAVYGASVKINRIGQETTTYIGDAMEERLDAYYANNGYPESIIIFRDGIAQNMFQETLREELTAIKHAIAKKVGEGKIKVTYIICQKRHHTRLFCDKIQEAVGKAQNVPPGTVVDREIVDKELFDFYLCSHFGIQGTSRPCHYTVLHDDSEYSTDVLQALSYHLCHVYARCTRSVGIPAPVYYADKAADRSKYHLLEWLGKLSGKPLSDQDKTTSVQSSRRSSMNKLTAVTEEMKKTMYFC